MFDVWCPHHESRVLLGPRSIESLANTPNGVVLTWRCHCGTHGTEVLGKRAPRVPLAERAARAAAKVAA